MSLSLTLTFDTVEELQEYLNNMKAPEQDQPEKAQNKPEKKTKPKTKKKEPAENDLDLDGLASLGVDLEGAPAQTGTPAETTEELQEETSSQEDKLGGFKSYEDLFKTAQTWFPSDKKAELVKILIATKDKVFESGKAPATLLDMTPDQEELFIPEFLEATKEHRK